MYLNPSSVSSATYVSYVASSVSADSEKTDSYSDPDSSSVVVSLWSFVSLVSDVNASMIYDFLDKIIDTMAKDPPDTH